MINLLWDCLDNSGGSDDAGLDYINQSDNALIVGFNDGSEFYITVNGAA